MADDRFDELEKWRLSHLRSPEKKHRQHKHHQWLTIDIGHPKLQQHLWAVVALMRAASSWDTFRRSLDRAFPKQNQTIPLPLDDQDE